MFKLDNAFLEELGLGTLPPVEKNKMLAHIYETLEMRVGMKLAEKMTNEQLDEFESYIQRKDEAGALKWLESNFPNYKEVVAEELEKLKVEVSQVAPQITAQFASQPLAANSPQQQTAPQSEYQQTTPQPPLQPPIQTQQNLYPTEPTAVQQPPAPMQQPVQPDPQQVFGGNDQVQQQSKSSALFSQQQGYSAQPVPQQDQDQLQNIQSSPPQPQTGPDSSNTNYGNAPIVPLQKPWHPDQNQ